MDFYFLNTYLVCTWTVGSFVTEVDRADQSKYDEKAMQEQTVFKGCSIFYFDYSFETQCTHYI